MNSHDSQEGEGRTIEVQRAQNGVLAALVCVCHKSLIVVYLSLAVVHSNIVNISYGEMMGFGGWGGKAHSSARSFGTHLSRVGH